MKLALAAVVAMAGSAHADDRAKERAVVAAIAKHDVGAITKLAPKGFRVANLWFGTKACEPFQGPDQAVAPEQVKALVTCLADLGVHDVKEGFISGTYGPGMPFAPALFNDGMLEGLWAPPPISPDALTIETGVFLTHMKTVELPPPGPDRGITTKVTVCVDAKGAIDGLEVEPAPDAAIEKAVHAWKVKPFALRGKPLRACTRVRISDDGGRVKLSPVMPAPDDPPKGAPRPENVAPSALEATRTGGDKVIVPDDKTKAEITIAKKSRLIGSLKLCLDTAGRITEVTLLKSTGFAAYDEKLQRTIKTTWTYAPYLVNGKAVPVCTAVTFIYSQK